MNSVFSPAAAHRPSRCQVKPADADEDLVRQARGGDLDAFAVLADRHGPMAYRVALRLLGQPEDAADVAEEAMVTAWRQLPGFRAETSFSTWLYRIVVRRALKQSFRAQPAPEADHGLTVNPVTAAVAALPPSQRVVMVLHHFEGLPDQEIARITDSTCPAVRSHLFRGRCALATTLRARSEPAERVTVP
jgi:RNA polymerase sigma-70 factor (ECF subfamily)